MKYLILITLSFFSINDMALAEYRVYQYSIQNKVNPDNNQNAVMRTSTLNPVAYLAYHGGSSLIKIDLLRTWICPGHTAHQQICKSPYEELNAEETP
jgi:hypothetical protein